MLDGLVIVTLASCASPGNLVAHGEAKASAYFLREMAAHTCHLSEAEAARLLGKIPSSALVTYSKYIDGGRNGNQDSVTVYPNDPNLGSGASCTYTH